MIDRGDREADSKPSNLLLEVSEELAGEFPEAKRLCRLYWAREPLPKGSEKFSYRVSDLTSVSGLSSGEVSRLVRSVSKVRLEGLICPNCGREREARNRTGYQQQVQAHIVGEACQICADPHRSGAGEGQRDYSLQELRELAARARQAQERKREARIAEEQREREVRAIEERKRRAVRSGWFVRARFVPPLEDMKLKHAIALFALGRACASEDFSYFRPVESVPERLTPTRDYDSNLLVDLNEHGLIGVDPDASSLRAFNFEREADSEELTIISYYPRSATWKLAEYCLYRREGLLMEEQVHPLKVFQDLEEWFDHTSTWPPLWAVACEGDEWWTLWKEISLHECLAYLELVLAEHNLPFKAGDRTRFVLSSVLETFSVAQVWNMIWRAGRDAAAFYMRQNPTRSHAANTVPGSIQRQAERALAEGWDLKGFRRNPQLPRSVLSEAFFGRALRIGDSGFTRTIPPRGVDFEFLPEILEDVAN